MRLRNFVFGLSAFAAALSPALGGADEFNDKQKAEIRAIIRDYIVKDPTLLKDALKEMDTRHQAEEKAQAQKTIAELGAKIYDSPNVEVVGNPKGSIALVEFFDYNCGYCKRSVGDVAELIKENPELKVVLRDFPVLNQGSLEAAQVALAARAQLQGEKFWDFHQKLLSTHGSIGKKQALEAAKEAGANVDKLEQDLKAPEISAALHETMEIADKLSINGTPTWILGDELIVGAMGRAEMNAKIANMKKCGKTACP